MAASQRSMWSGVTCIVELATASSAMAGMRVFVQGSQLICSSCPARVAQWLIAPWPDP